MPLSSKPTVLHYTGADHDRGGVMSVVHALASAGRFECVLGVSPGFAARRVPALASVTLPAIACETIGLATAWRARRVARAASAWLAEDTNRVFHAHSRAGLLVALWLARWGERRVVVSVHCYGRQRWFYRWAARRLDGRLYWLSPAMKRYYGVAADDAWAQCIPGCLPERLVAELHTPRVPRRGDVLRLGGVGALVRWKGWHLIIDALARLPAAGRERVRFEHIGSHDGSAEGIRYAAELRAGAEQHGVASLVTWRGEEPTSVGLFRQIDCLVVASDNEPFSIAVLEALAAGVPVLAADSGGARDLIEPGRTGWFFRSGNAGNLAEAIMRLADGDALAGAQVGETVIRPYSAPVVAEKWERVYMAL